MHRGWLAQRNNIGFIKICSNGPAFDSAYTKNFLCAIKYIHINVQLWFFEKCHWLKRHLWSKYCGYLSLRERVKNILTLRNGPCKHWCHAALVPAIQRGWHSCGSQSQRRGWRKRWKEEIGIKKKQDRYWPVSRLL